MTSLSTPELEDALFSMMKAFEALAVAVYEKEAPALCGPQKRAFVTALAQRVQGDASLDKTSLSKPIHALLDKVGAQAKDALLVQGLILEQLGRVIYERIIDTDVASPAAKELAKQGQAAAIDVLDKVPDLIEAQIGTGDKLFGRFVEATGPVLSQLDMLGENVDEVFGTAFGIRFADLMGDLTAELLPMCTALGIERRKLVVHLTAALMNSA